MSSRSPLLILLASAVLLFTAGMNTISLQSLDDAFYARKGVEMARLGNFFTVTLGGEPSFQNPPLQFWIMGRSFALFGENDFAARLPIVIMAVGMLLATLRIAALTIGPSTATASSVGVTAIRRPSSMDRIGCSSSCRADQRPCDSRYQATVRFRPSSNGMLGA